jgi:hypothetical protein
MLWKKVIASRSYRSGHKEAVIASHTVVIALFTFKPLALLKVIAVTARQKR